MYRSIVQGCTPSTSCTTRCRCKISEGRERASDAVTPMRYGYCASLEMPGLSAVVNSSNSPQSLTSPVHNESQRCVGRVYALFESSCWNVALFVVVTPMLVFRCMRTNLPSTLYRLGVSGTMSRLATLCVLASIDPRWSSTCGYCQSESPLVM